MGRFHDELSMADHPVHSNLSWLGVREGERRGCAGGPADARLSSRPFGGESMNAQFRETADKRSGCRIPFLAFYFCWRHIRDLGISNRVRRRCFVACSSLDPCHPILTKHKMHSRLVCSRSCERRLQTRSSCSFAPPATRRERACPRLS